MRSSKSLRSPVRQHISYSCFLFLYCFFFFALPGVDLEPGFCVSPRALITSTSNWPFLSTIPIWMSPEREKKEAHISEKQHSRGDGTRVRNRKTNLLLVWCISVLVTSPPDHLNFIILKRRLKVVYAKRYTCKEHGALSW